jgi:hypothetical protein
MSNSIFDNRSIAIIISLIWGMGLAILFRKVCQNDQCTVVKVPIELSKNRNIIRDKNNRCYQLHKYGSECIY